MVAQEQGWIASRNSTGHEAKVRKGRRVTGGVKAGSAVRVGGRRVTSVTGAESEIDTNLIGQEFGRHSQSGKCPVSPRAEPLKRTCETPGTRRSQMTCPNSGSWKLKDEVVKNAQSYIRRHATIIFRTLSPNHEAVKCLSAFGDQAQKFAVEVLAIIEWGTQHWKLQETFQVPVIPRWLRTPEFTQTMTPLRGELPLMPTGGHIEDIRVHCLAMWSWMAVLLQYWQDHMTPYLYRGRFRHISDLAATVIRDINLWLLHQAHFGWGYVAMNTTLWIDQRDHFAMEHQEE